MNQTLKHTLKILRNYLRGLIHRGNSRYCFICEKEYSKFLNRGGTFPRENAICPGCNSLERHRIAWHYLKNKTDLFKNKNKTFLHVAPEECFEKKLRKHLGKNYITADLFDPHVDVKMDITNINYPREHFDIIYCAHVLEHVREDKKALKEFYRILKNDGWAILLVPIEGDKTVEAPDDVNDPEELFKLFGQRDHVRQYGTDYIDRLREAGFTVTLTKPKDLFNHAELKKFGLLSGTDDIYYCRKQ